MTLRDEICDCALNALMWWSSELNHDLLARPWRNVRCRHSCRVAQCIYCQTKTAGSVRSCDWFELGDQSPGVSNWPRVGRRCRFWLEYRSGRWGESLALPSFGGSIEWSARAVDYSRTWLGAGSSRFVRSGWVEKQADPIELESTMAGRAVHCDECR